MPRLDQLKALFADDPTDSELPYMIAHELAKAGDHEGARTWFSRCRAINPDHLYCYYHEARSLELLDRLKDAGATLRIGLERARDARDTKATYEIEGYLSQLGEHE